MREVTEHYMLKAAYQQWEQEQKTDSAYNLERAKRLLPVLIQEVTTDRQREMLEMYFYRDMKAKDIALELGLTRSAVSRTLHRGIKRLFNILKWVDPYFYNLSKPGNLSKTHNLSKPHKLRKKRKPQ